jgi:hypothetical protein
MYVVRIEVDTFSAVFVQVKNYDQKVSASKVQQLTDDLKKYGYELLGKETPFVTMVMLLGPGENVDPSLDDDDETLAWGMCGNGSSWPLTLFEVLAED